MLRRATADTKLTLILLHGKSCYYKRREAGGHRVMIEIIISENDDNDERPSEKTVPFLPTHINLS